MNIEVGLFYLFFSTIHIADLINNVMNIEEGSFLPFT